MKRFIVLWSIFISTYAFSDLTSVKSNTELSQHTSINDYTTVSTKEKKEVDALYHKLKESLHNQGMSDDFLGVNNFFIRKKDLFQDNIDIMGIGDHRTLELIELEKKGYIQIDTTVTVVSENTSSNVFKKAAYMIAKQLRATIVIVSEVNDMPNIAKNEKIYFASYYALGRNAISTALDIYTSELPDNLKNRLQVNTGAYVNYLVKYGNAYNANIMEKDVITAINDTKIRSDFVDVMLKETKKSKDITVTLLRIVDGEVRELKIPVHLQGDIPTLNNKITDKQLVY